jgi:hypothetical protein
MRKLFFALVAVTLSGCLFDVNQARVTPEYRQLKNKTSILVFLDPAPRLHHLQLSTLDSTATTAELEGWDAGALVTQFLAQRMRKMGLEVKALPYARSDFPNPYDSSMAYANLERMRGAIAEWGKAHDLDLVAVVYRLVEKDFIGDSIENMLGYGLVRHADERTGAYAAIYLEVIDTDNGLVVGNSDALKNTPIDNAIWDDEYNVDKTPVSITGDKAAQLLPLVTQALTDAVMLAAQESGISN